MDSHRSLMIYFELNLFLKSHQKLPCDGNAEMSIRYIVNMNVVYSQKLYYVEKWQKKGYCNFPMYYGYGRLHPQPSFARRATYNASLM